MPEFEETHEVHAVVIRDTEKRLNVKIAGKPYWIAYSQIDGDSELGETSKAGDSGSLVMAYWLAEHLELV